MVAHKTEITTAGVDHQHLKHAAGGGHCHDGTDKRGGFAVAGHATHQVVGLGVEVYVNSRFVAAVAQQEGVFAVMFLRHFQPVGIGGAVGLYLGQPVGVGVLDGGMRERPFLLLRPRGFAFGLPVGGNRQGLGIGVDIGMRWWRRPLRLADGAGR